MIGIINPMKLLKNKKNAEIKNKRKCSRNSMIRRCFLQICSRSQKGFKAKSWQIWEERMTKINNLEKRNTKEQEKCRHQKSIFIYFNFFQKFTHLYI